MYRSVSQWEKWLIADLPKSGDIALDVGANVGQWATDLAEIFRLVICFEPHPKVFKKLCKDMKSFENVLCLERAVSDSHGRRSLLMYETNTHSGFYETLFTKQDKITDYILVDCVSLDEFSLSGSLSGKVDFIKIDVEGAEVDVCQGALELLKRDRPQLLIEVHSSENGKRIMQLLEYLGYEVPVTIHSPRDCVGSEFWSEHFWISS